MSFISPLASIHPEAVLGENITVEPFAVITENVVIGSGSHIASHAVIRSGARIGRNCKIFTGAVISSIPQDLKFNNEESTVEIGDGVTVREYATINRGTVHRLKTEIGENTLIMSYAHVAHDCRIGKNVIIVNSVNIAGHVDVDDYAVIGGNCGVHQFCKVGKHVMVAGGCIVRKDVPPYVLCGHDPLRYVGINAVGLKRRGFTHEEMNEIRNMYRKIFTDGIHMKDALRVVREEFSDSSHKNDLLDFISRSTRGLIKGYPFKDKESHRPSVD